MNRFFLVIVALLSAYFSMHFKISSSGAAEPKKLLVVYTGNLLAELKPCGCAKEEDQGGIGRRMQYLKDLRKNKPNLLLVDTGTHFKAPTSSSRNTVPVSHNVVTSIIQYPPNLNTGIAFFYSTRAGEFYWHRFAKGQNVWNFKLMFTVECSV